MFEIFKPSQELLILFIIIMNFLSYSLYFLDKKRAIKKQRRISEKILLLVSFLLGGLGAWIGMKQFKHKTKQLKFKLFVPFSSVITIVVVLIIMSNLFT